MHCKKLLESSKLDVIIRRLCYQLIEDCGNFEETALIGLQPRGVFFSERIYNKLKLLKPKSDISYGYLDATLFRDDLRRRESPLIPADTSIDFLVEDKKVIIIDDVLYTGRSIRSAIDATLAYGRPKEVKLMVLVDRRFSRQLPIEPNYVGISVDTRTSQNVKVSWASENNTEDDKIELITREDKT